MILERLAKAHGHVVLGEKHIARQHEIISELERDGHDSLTARDLLDTLKSMQLEHVAHRDRLEKEILAAPD